jgi:hypothetical protein
MSVKGHLALLVGVFVVALAAVTLVQRSVVADLGGVVWDVARSQAPKARAARELRASHLAERAALAEVDRLLADQQAAADRAVARRRAGGPPAGSRPFTPEGQDAARYR